MDRDALGKLTNLIDGYEKEAVDLQTELCKRPALGPVNGGDGTFLIVSDKLECVFNKFGNLDRQKSLFAKP